MSENREEFTVDDLIDLNAPIDDFDKKELTEADIKGFVTDEPIVPKAAAPVEESFAAGGSDDFDDFEFLDDDDFTKEVQERSAKISPRVASLEEEEKAVKTIQEIKYSDDSFLGKKGKKKSKKRIEEDDDFLDDDLEILEQPKPKKKAKPSSGKKTTRRQNDAREAKKEAQINKVKKNIVLIIIAIIAVIVAIVAISKIVGVIKDKKEKQRKEQPVSVQEYETNGYEEINAMINSYYECYAAGETDRIVQYATPMSDAEKDYIQMYSQFIDSYQNITCYTKTGETDGEFIVSVAFDLKFKDAPTTAPGLDFFYVRTNSNGQVYIDNIYSPFNLRYQENSLGQDITQLIDSYKNSNDLLALQASVQAKFDEAVAKDSALADLLEADNGPIVSAVSEWRVRMDEQSMWQEKEVTENIGGAGEEEEVSAPVEYTVQFSETPYEGEKWLTPMDETGVNIRKEPSTETDIVASALGGSELRLLGETDNGWYHIKTGDVEGFVKKDFVKETTLKLPEENNN